MPELPEVETTVRALNKEIKGLFVTDIWSSYNSSFHKGKNNIKDIAYFDSFKKSVVGQRIVGAERRAKNVLIGLSNGKTILVHMKMTGHFLYGKFFKMAGQPGEIWKPRDANGPLSDPVNRFIRLVFTLSNSRHLAFSDLRRFAKVYLFPTSEKSDVPDLKNIGPDPLSRGFTAKVLKERLLKKPGGKIKQILMDQEIVAGIGNIYSDEILWLAGIHPFSAPAQVPEKALLAAHKAMKTILDKAIEIGGDSMSDFRKLDGKPGGFQNFHKAYRKTGELCSKTGCKGKIVRQKMGGRSAHFCPVHQKLYR